MSEWQLLVDAEGIYPEDGILIEYEDGGTRTLTLIRYSDRWVYLRDPEAGDTIKFDTETLESENGYPIIVGKA